MINSLNKFRVGQLIHYADELREGIFGTIISNDRQGCVIYWYDMKRTMIYYHKEDTYYHKQDSYVIDKIREIEND